MGVKLKALLIHDVMPFPKLAGKKLVIDGCNLLFKYINKIRRDDQLLYSSNGEPVSHIIGFFYFCINLLERRVRPIFVFDGYPPKEKREKSPEKINRLVKMWQIYDKERIQRKILFQDSLFLYDKFISDVQGFIRLMGLPVVRGLSEGEGQGARLVREGKAYGMISRDLDSLLFGCPRTFRDVYFKQDSNLCTLIDLKSHLERWQITREQLIDVAMLIGTDYNPGIKGIGPKKGLKLVLKYGCLEDIPDLEYSWDVERIRSLFLKPATIEADPVFRAPNTGQIAYYLEQKGFSSRRINKGVQRLRIAFKQVGRKQSQLTAFVKSPAR